MGQGEMLVTPLEMSLATATIANDGVRPGLRLMAAVGDQALRWSEQPRQVLDKEVAQQVRSILAESFAVGQRTAALPVADLAGRAGSADSGMAGAPPHAWFIGFAPVAQPRYAIAVIVEHGDQGWEVAAPVAIRVVAELGY
jgi:peptidoglycan glycosyltransferase